MRFGGFSASITADTPVVAGQSYDNSHDWLAWYSESWMGCERTDTGVDSKDQVVDRAPLAPLVIPGGFTTRTARMAANVLDRQSSTVKPLTLYLCCPPSARDDVAGANPKAGLVVRNPYGQPIFQSHRVPVRVLGEVVGCVTPTTSIDQGTLKSSFPGGTWQSLDRSYCLTETAFRVDVGPSNRDYALLSISAHVFAGGAWCGAAMRMFKFEKSGGRAYLWTAAFMPGSSYIAPGIYNSYPNPEDLVVGVTIIDVTGA